MSVVAIPAAPLAMRDGLVQPQRGLAIAAVLSAMSLVVLDAGMANVALPTLARTLEATAAESVLVITAYQLGLVMMLLPCAALGERFGARRVFQVGVAVFLAGSVFCALAPTLFLLVAARFLQGLGGAAIMALGIALLRFTVPSTRLGAAIGWNALTVAVSSAAAPTVGALIIARFDWWWLFLVNMPIGAVVLVASRALPPVSGRSTRLDLVSMVLNGAAFALLVIGAEALAKSPAWAALLIGLGAAAFSVLVRREAPKAAPLVPVDLLRGRSFRLSVIASVLCFIGQAAGMVALAFHLQHGLGQSPLQAGLYICTWPITVAGASVLAGRLSDRMPTAWLCAAGAVCLAAGLAMISVWPLQGDPRALAGFAALCGLGFGLFQVPNNRNLFFAAPPNRSGAAGGMQGLARLTGQTSGAVLMTLLFGALPLEAAPRTGLAIGAALALSSGVVSVLRAPGRERRDDATT